LKIEVQDQARKNESKTLSQKFPRKKGLVEGLQ
jgi:hypothetical protein